MKPTYITEKTAKLAKQIGFDRGCSHLHGEYDGYIGCHHVDNYNRMNNEKQFSAPAQSELQQWIRDTYFLHPYIVPLGDTKTWQLANIGYTNRTTDNYRLLSGIKHKYEFVKFDSYEDALEVGLEEMLIEISEINGHNNNTTENS